MFGTQFYPTPPEVGRKMAEPYIDDLRGRVIFDPGAGSGSLLEIIKSAVAEYHTEKAKERLLGKAEKKAQRRAARNLEYNAGFFADHARTITVDDDIEAYCMEIDADLNATLGGKGFTVIGSDFLRYRGQYRFDYIFMNPPFRNGIEHLLHAWEIASPGCVIRCLLNAANFRGSSEEFSRTKHLLNLIENFGDRENLGFVFKGEDVPRIAEVDVDLVTLVKPQKERSFSFEWKPPTETPDVDHSIGGALANADYLEAMERSYRLVVDAYDDLLAAMEKIRFYGGSFNQVFGHKPDDEETDPRAVAHKLINATELAYSAYSNNGTDNERTNAFINQIKAAAWREVFDRTKLKTLTTASVREDFEKYSQQQGMMDFTKENVVELIDTLFMNRGMIMQKCLVEVFDSFRRYHDDNTVHWEGWKTNDAWKVKQKVIMPYFIELCGIMYRFSVRYNRREQLRDIDRVMCNLTGKKVENVVTIMESLEERFKQVGVCEPGDPFDGKCESTFFYLTFFKKGTLHIKFKDQKLCELFNLRAAAGKNWLPGE